MNTSDGRWAMRGPQKKLHFYEKLGPAALLADDALRTTAICGASDGSFAYSITETPTPPICGRCLKQRGGPK